jgi:hypothetical protein
LSSLAGCASEEKKEPYYVHQSLESMTQSGEWQASVETDTVYTSDPRQAFGKGIIKILARKRTDEAMREAGMVPVIRLRDIIVLDKNGKDVETILGVEVADSLAKRYQQLESEGGEL